MAGKPMPKEGVETHTKPPVKEESAKTIETAPAKTTTTHHPAVNLAHPPLKMTVEEHEHIVTTLPMPEKGVPKAPAMSPTQKKLMAEQEKSEPSATSQVKAGDEPMKLSLTPPPPPKGGLKAPAMSPTQKKLMAEQERPGASTTDRPKLSFLDEIKKRGETPATVG